MPEQAHSPIQLIGEKFPYTKIEVSKAASKLYDAWIGALVKRIKSGEDRNDICREALADLYGAPQGSLILNAQFDPRNVTLEPEYYGDCDMKRFLERKPLLWLWYMFDKSPAGLNLDFGFKLRRALAPFIFKKVGKNFKCFPFVEFTFGYNLEVGDDVVFHRWVFIDDRFTVKIGNHTSLSDYVNVYSHTHDINCRYFVSNLPTIIGSNCRVTYHSTVLAGTKMADNSMLGALGLLTRETRQDAVYVGIPAKKVKDKDPRHHCRPGDHPDETIT
jgi:acetyltransferase-like isoleucine patch superfamily enzyme